MILVAAVISTYSMVRHAPVQESPKILTAMGEMNADIKRILDFTVGYYGSILQVTGNSTYAKGLTTSYLSSGLVNIARSHPEWNPSFNLTSSSVSTHWYMPQSYSMGNLSLTYSLANLGIEGVLYETSSVLKVTMLKPANSNQARFSVTHDNNIPELRLKKENFWFYKYDYDDSTWERVNPENDPIISSNGTYILNIPSGVNKDAYSIQVEDQRGLMVQAFYSKASLTSGFPQFTYNFDWDATGLGHIYDSLTTDTMVIEVLQNGTLLWLGQSLELLPQPRPIPPLPVKALHINQTIDGVDQEVPFQVEDWASNYRIPLGLSGNASLFSKHNMLVFLVNDHVEKATLWWDGNDAATQTSYAWQNQYFSDNPSSGTLDNGFLELNIHNFYVVSSVVGGSTSCTADFLRVNDEEPSYGAEPAFIIYNGVVRDIVQQEPEYSDGVTGSPNFYSQVVLTFPANATYYTYAARTIFVNSAQSRTVSDLSAIQLSGLSGPQLTEDGTDGGYPEASLSTGFFYNGTPTSWVHHWSQFMSGDSGAGLMFTDTDNLNLYLFDDIAGDKTGALNVLGSGIEFNPVEDGLNHDVSFLYPLDVTWHGAVVTFEGEPIYRSEDDVGLWVMVENPPWITMDGYDYDYVDNNLSNIDSSDGEGSHSYFIAQKHGPDSIFDTLTEYREGEKIEDYVDNISDVDNSIDVGSQSNFTALQAGPDSIYDTLTEENTSPSSNSTLLDDGFEGYPWDTHWDNSYSNWREDNYPVHSGSSSAHAYNYNEGYFTSDSLDASDASALYVDFWFRKTGTGYSDFTLYYYDGSSYDLIDELDNNGPDNTWLHYTAKITDSQYFVSNFRIRFDATLYYGEVWVDDVVITKEAQSANNYELDMEVQFTNLVDFLPTNELCIYAGTLGSEDLRVDYWTGSDWANLAADLTADSWNNFTVSLTSTTFTVRFNGGNEIGDTTQDQWEIDAVLLSSEGGGGVEDAVDNDTSDVDFSADKGTHSNFSAQQTGPDSIYDILTESGVTTNSHSLDATGGYMRVGNGTPDWGSTTGTISFWIQWDTVAGRPWGQHDNMETRFSGTNLVLDWGGSSSLTSSTSFTSGKWYFIAITWNEFSNDLILYVGDENNAPTVDASTGSWFSTVSTVGVTQNNFMASKGGVNPTDGHGDDLRYWNTDRGLAAIQSDYDTELTGSETNLRSYFKLNNNFDDIGPDNNDGSGSGSYSFSTDVAFGGSPADYELDLEVQWTGVPCSLPNEELSIYGGTMGAEDILVDVWNGTGWETVFTDLSPGWNNVSITEWLTTSNFTIRFRDGTDVGDSSPDTWQIDVALIHVWNVQGEGYKLDLEEQWTNVDYDENNEELCIYGGSMGSEDIMVDVWDTASSSWVTVFTDLNSGWNNVTVSAYLTSPTFTIRFKGADETDDTTQDFWAIDATLLHLWS